VRKAQLEIFLEYYKEYVDAIFIIEQSQDGRPFNRGKLLNIGYELASKSEANTFIFHDVDLLSSVDILPLYHRIPENPCHIARLWTSKYNFYTFLGGIVSFDRDCFEKVNGFPNNFWGWGGEDDSLYNRIVSANLKLELPQDDRTDKSTPLIKDLYHKPEGKSNPTEANKKKERILRDLKEWKRDGLNSLRYKILDFEEKGNVCHIKVNL
jgi:predicted glycosyltransferase involved in capsule biosynthesis